jgi:K(+)-stimulated pyrophosphate-energized sodium pump
LSDFLADHGALVALVCAACAVVYGLVTSRALLALSPGNEVMRGLSAAIQEGASAYLRRQYRTIALVGIVLFIALIPLQNIEVAIGFLIGGLAAASAGFIGMNVKVIANARLAQAPRGGVGAAHEVA